MMRLTSRFVRAFWERHHRQTRWRSGVAVDRKADSRNALCDFARNQTVKRRAKGGGNCFIDMRW